MRIQINRWWLMLFLCLSVSLTNAQETPNARQARQIFDHTYNMVFGKQGCQLHYAVNIIGLYKTHGDVWYRNESYHYVEPRYSAWCDGTTYYKADKKSKVVEIYNALQTDRDKYAGKFAFEPNNYKYAIGENKDNYIIFVDAKKNVNGVKHAKCYIDKKTRYPTSLKLKIMFFWVTVHVSKFKHGGIHDESFKFPANDFKDYKVVDKRKG